MALPKRPFLPSLGGYRQPEVKDLAARLSAWGTGVNGVLDALPPALAALERRMTELEAASGVVSAHASSHLPGGSDALATATAGAATPGDTVAEGSSSSFARADHRHSLPPFGRGSGEFAEGDDLDGIDDRLTDLENVSPIITQWTPDAPPTGTAHAKTDEFTDSDGSAWNARWTEFDQSGELTTAVQKGFGQMTIATQGGANRTVGMYQAVPAVADWCFASKMAGLQTANTTQNLVMGLFLSEDLGSAPTTADWAAIDLIQANTTAVRTATYTAYNVAATAVTSLTRVDRSIYLRVRITSTTTVKMDWSDDGTGWHEMRSFTIGFTPVHFGIMARNPNTGANAFVRVQWFRVYEGAVALEDFIPGGRVLNVFA